MKIEGVDSYVLYYYPVLPLDFSLEEHQAILREERAERQKESIPELSMMTRMHLSRIDPLCEGGKVLIRNWCLRRLFEAEPNLFDLKNLEKLSTEEMLTHSCVSIRKFGFKSREEKNVSRNKGIT